MSEWDPIASATTVQATTGPDHHPPVPDACTGPKIPTTSPCQVREGSKTPTTLRAMPGACMGPEYDPDPTVPGGCMGPNHPRPTVPGTCTGPEPPRPGFLKEPIAPQGPDCERPQPTR